MECQNWPAPNLLSHITIEKARPALGKWVSRGSTSGDYLEATITTGWTSGVTETSRTTETYGLELASSAGFEFYGLGASRSLTLDY